MKMPLITNDKFYEFLLNDKKHTEDRRDEINKYYITLLSAIIGLIPFIEKILKEVNPEDKSYVIRLS